MRSATCGCSNEDARLPRFYAMFAAFGLSTLIAPMMNNAGLYWIAIELTTLISTFLVAFEQEAASIEAAWKYIIVVSAGISLALLGTVLFYWAGTFVIGPTYDMTWKVLQEAAAAPQSRAGVAGVPARSDRLRHEGRSRADAHLAARRA